jgi:hypothetical protein
MKKLSALRSVKTLSLAVLISVASIQSSYSGVLVEIGQGSIELSSDSEKVLRRFDGKRPEVSIGALRGLVLELSSQVLSPSSVESRALSSETEQRNRILDEMAEFIQSQETGGAAGVSSSYALTDLRKQFLKIFGDIQSEILGRSTPAERAALSKETLSDGELLCNYVNGVISGRFESLRGYLSRADSPASDSPAQMSPQLADHLRRHQGDAVNETHVDLAVRSMRGLWLSHQSALAKAVENSSPLSRKDSSRSRESAFSVVKDCRSKSLESERLDEVEGEIALSLPAELLKK